MRVAHVTTSFGKYSETFIVDTIRLLGEHGIESRVLTRAHRAEQPTEGIDVREIRDPAPGEGLVDRVTRIFRKPPSADALRRDLFEREIRAFRPGLVHAHFGTNGTFIRRPARRMGLPLVVSFHGFDASMCTQSEAWVAKFRHLFRDAAAVTVVSRFMRDRLAEIGCPPGKLHVVHVGVRFSFFRFQERDAGDGRTVRLLCVGRHVAKKGFDAAIRAVATLAARGDEPRFELDLIGDGPLRARHEELVRSLGLEDRVRLLPACRHDEVAAAMQRAHVLVVPSRTSASGNSEGIPTVVMEACASGLPVVASRHAGIPEALPPENHGCLAAEGDDADLAARILAVSADPARWREIARRNFEHVQREFSLETETRKLEEIYRSCVRAEPVAPAAPKPSAR